MFHTEVRAGFLKVRRSDCGCACTSLDGCAPVGTFCEQHTGPFGPTLPAKELDALSKFSDSVYRAWMHEEFGDDE